MEKVREDINLTEHAEFMLHDLARDIALRRQGNLLKKIMRMLNFPALRKFVIVSWFDAVQSSDDLLPENDDEGGATSTKSLDIQIEHDGHYALMNWIRTTAGQS